MIIYLLSKKAYQNNIFSLNESATDRYIDKLIYEYLPEQLKPYFNTKIGDLIKENSKWITSLGLTQEMAKKYSNTLFKDYLRIHICQIFDIEGNNGPKKYKRGIFRIVITELGYLSQFDNNNIDLFKNDVIYIDKNSSIDLEASELDSNFNGLSFNQIHSMFKNKRKSQFNQVRDNVMLDFRNNNKSNYIVIPIYKQSECLQFSPYTSWCITKQNIGEANYNSYTNGGRRFYIFLRKDYKTISEPKVIDKYTPLDNYGLSMISVLVNAEGEISIITTRWNHEYDGEYKNPDEETIKMFQSVIGMNLFEVCKPYTREELHRMGIILFDEVQELLDNDKKSLSDIFDEYDECYVNDNKYYKVKLNNKWNYVTSDRKLLCDFWYYNVYDFNEGFARVQREEDENWNFIDKNGNEISNTWYYYVGNFKEGFARVQREEDRKWNFIDKNGNEISNTWYYNVYDFNEGFARVQKEDRRYNFIDKNGKEISDKWYYIVDDFKEGFARVQREEGGYWNFIDKNGKEISDTWYKYVNNFNKGFAAVKKEDRKWNFIDKNGKEISDKWYYYIGDFKEGFARVQREDGKWNFIDKNGDEISNTWYYNVFDFKEDFACVQRKEDGNWNFIDKNGNKISNTWYYSTYDFEEGFARIQRKKDRKWNFIDKNGKEILDNWYHYVCNFVNGFARVQREEGGYWGLINKNGKELIHT